ncbi:MAG: efflux RND transporter permease subunit [Deferribacteres bacterium]|nr:efflux RND transporter permease subunit [candidate division KSB1 bacterium]MCB9500837.1 efflux RND transporter permease subunit [Deferribacteres bacterium]
MKIVNFSITRPVTITMFTVAAVIFGYVAFDRLPINLLPDISYPSLTVRTEYTGTAPGEMEYLISKPVEEAVGVVSGVVRTSSISRPGISDVTLEFEWGTNMDFASLDVREKMDLLNLPQDAEKPILLRFDPSLDPIMRIALAGQESLISLRLLAEERIKQDLESLDGVASVLVSGGLEEEIQVNLNEGKLASLGISINSVITRLAQENVNLTGGTLKDGEAEFLVRTLNEFTTVEEMNDIVVIMKNGVPVLLKDIADIRKSHKERKVITHLNGAESVEIAIYKEADKNTVLVADGVKQRLFNIVDEFKAYDVPIDVTIINDQSQFIQSSVDEVMNTAIWGGIFAVIVLFLFLRSLKSTTIISLAIPISVIVTFFCMYLADVSLNIMSLGGLALGVGMLVDNAIVVLEAIDRYRGQGMGIAEAASKGASEVGTAVIASTLTTICVFVPIIFVEGIAGQLFNDQALAVTFSLAASLFVALTLIPMLSAREYKSGTTEEGAASGSKSRNVAHTIFVAAPAIVLSFIGKIIHLVAKILDRIFAPVMNTFDRGLQALLDFYPVFLEKVLNRRLLLISSTVLLFILSLFGIGFIGTELIPEISQGEFFIDIKMPIGTPVEETDRTVNAIALAVQPIDNIASVYAVAGTAAQMGFSSTEERENLGQIHVRLNEGLVGEVENDVMEKIRQKLEEIPGIEYKFSRPTLFSFSTPVEVEVRGYNLQELERLSLQLTQDMRTIDGLVDVKASTEGGNPEVQIVFNRKRVAQMGLDVSTIGQIVRRKVQGEVATEFTRQDRKVDIRVRDQEEFRRNVDDLHRMAVNPQGEVPIPLASVADIVLEKGPSEIRRVDQERVALITANISGRDLGSIAQDIQGKIDQIQLPPDFRIKISGQQREMATSFDSMKLAIALAVFLVYLVMASQFESLVQPFIIMFTIPFALIGVVLTLLVTQTPISVVVLIGVIMLAGIVVNNAIVLVDYINQLRKEGKEKREAIKLAGQVRLRPILMTTLTTVLGLLPMALGLGEGAELRTPLAITVIGGLLVGTLLTLVVIPTVYDAVVKEKQ